MKTITRYGETYTVIQEIDGVRLCIPAELVDCAKRSGYSIEARFVLIPKAKGRPKSL